MRPFLAALAAALLLAPVQSASEPADIDLSHSEMRPYFESFAADRASLQRFYSIESASGTRARMRRYYADWRARLAGLDFDRMSQDGKVDYVLLRNYLDHELRKLDLDAQADDELAPWTPFAGSIIRLEEARRAVEHVDGRASAETLSKITAAADAAQHAEESAKPASDPKAAEKRREEGNRAAQRVAALHSTLRNWFTFYDSYDPQFTWWAAAPYKTTDAALTRYETFLREKVAGLKPTHPTSAGPGDNRNFTPAGAAAGSIDDIIGHPAGRAVLMSELAFEMIPYTPEELISMANTEFAWCEDQMKRNSREMGFGDNWKAALEKVKTMYPEPGKQPEVARDLILEAEKFLDDNHLVTIPPIARETWGIRMMPPSMQLIAPFFLGGESLLVAYPTADMTYEQKMNTLRGNSVPMSHAVVFHEMIPGHELQGYMARRYKAYRMAALGTTPFLVEGWSLHWELEMWDRGFHKTPEERIAALFWHMHRCARIIFSLSFHLGRMTPRESVDFLVNRVGFEPENAAGEVRRSLSGGYGVLYQAAYLLGGIQIYSLEKELTASGKMTPREFHDAVLRENAIPIEMIRASLTNQKLTRDYVTSWRFSPAELRR